MWVRFCCTMTDPHVLLVGLWGSNAGRVSASGQITSLILMEIIGEKTYGTHMNFTLTSTHKSINVKIFKSYEVRSNLRIQQNEDFHWSTFLWLHRTYFPVGVKRNPADEETICGTDFLHMYTNICKFGFFYDFLKSKNNFLDELIAKHDL